MLTALDHVNLHTEDPEALAGWYERVLGLKRGWRPNFSVPGIWLYLGDQAVVHLVKIGTAPARAPTSLEHFAFTARGMADFLATLDREGVAFQRVDLDDIDIVQINVRDPLGTHIHVDFRPSDELAAS